METYLEEVKEAIENLSKLLKEGTSLMQSPSTTKKVMELLVMLRQMNNHITEKIAQL
jgi:hypothetical protein